MACLAGISPCLPAGPLVYLKYPGTFCESYVEVLEGGGSTCAEQEAVSKPVLIYYHRSCDTEKVGEVGELEKGGITHVRYVRYVRY